MSKITVLRSAIGGAGIALGIVGIFFNAAAHNPVGYILAGVVGILGGGATVVLALQQAK